jgi:hypothetical protein
VLSTAGPDKAPPPRLAKTAQDDLYQPNALSVLRRRLVHIEHAARRVAQLAKEAT